MACPAPRRCPGTDRGRAERVIAEASALLTRTIVSGQPGTRSPVEAPEDLGAARYEAPAD
jgi:hypothetical protein